MNTITRIEVERAEGPLTSDFTRHIFDGQDAEQNANAYLREIARTAPRDGGYDKADVVVTLVSGDTVQTRHDVKHFTCPDADLDVRAHLHDFLFYHVYPEQIPWIKAECDEIKRAQHVTNLRRDYAENVSEFLRLLQILDGK